MAGLSLWHCYTHITPSIGWSTTENKGEERWWMVNSGWELCWNEKIGEDLLSTPIIVSFDMFWHIPKISIKNLYHNSTTHIYIYIYVCVCACVYMWIQIYIYIYIHTHIYIYLYASVSIASTFLNSLTSGGFGAKCSGHGFFWSWPGAAARGWAAEHYWQLSDKMQASLATWPLATRKLPLNYLRITLDSCEKKTSP